MTPEQRRFVEDYLEDDVPEPKAIPKTLFIPDETHLPGVWTTEVTEEGPVDPRREPTFARRVFGTGEAPTSLGKALGRLGWLLLALILWTIIGLIIWGVE